MAYWPTVYITGAATRKSCSNYGRSSNSSSTKAPYFFICRLVDIELRKCTITIVQMQKKKYVIYFSRNALFIFFSSNVQFKYLYICAFCAVTWVSTHTYNLIHLNLFLYSNLTFPKSLVYWRQYTDNHFKSDTWMPGGSVTLNCSFLNAVSLGISSLISYNFWIWSLSFE